MKPSVNGFKGYNFQGSVYCYLLCMMDLHRKIIELDAEKPVDNNFDDIYVNTEVDSYYFQVKNYQNVKFEKIKVSNDVIRIPGYDPINLGEKKAGYKNILLVKDLIIPADKKSINILGFDCYESDKCYIAGFHEDEINNAIRNGYSDEKRFNDIMLLADSKINNCSFNFKITDLPKMYLFDQKLQEETINVRNIILNSSKNILFVVGKPGVGKSHLVNELISSNKLDNYLLERLWVSENDADKYERLKYENFIADISKQLFSKSYLEDENTIIEELDRKKITLVIDGLDHVENYNEMDLEKFFNFFEKMSSNKLLVFTRPLKRIYEYESFTLENWSERETLDYLEYVNVNDYEIRLKIYEISKGYPIITSFLAKHFLICKEIPELKNIDSLNDFYDILIKDGIVGLSIFLINNSYFKIGELNDLLTPMEYGFVTEIIKNYPYLFSIKYDRVYLIHDSLNLYLRTKNPNYIELNSDKIKFITNEISNGNYKYISRIDYFDIEEKVKVECVKKYCNFDYCNGLLKKTYDYEILIDIVCQFGYIIYRNYKEFSINDFYEYILLSECINRDHHDGFYLLIIERIKYYLSNDLLKIEDIYSTKLLFYSLSTFIRKNIDDLSDLYSGRFDDTERELDDFSDALRESVDYFDIFDEQMDCAKYLEKNINHVDISDIKTLVHLIAYLYVNNKRYKGFEEIANLVMNNEKEKAIALFIPICRTFLIRDFMAKSGINELEDYLYSLGFDNGNNYYKKLSLRELIIKFSGEGSFYVCEYICKYLRLARKEKRKVDIESLGMFYYMYYNRKDYSVYKLPLALIIFYRKNYLELKESIKLINEAMEMSEKGIRTIMTDFFNLMTMDEFKIGLRYWNNKVNICDLVVDKINVLDKPIMIDYLEKEMSYYARSLNINSESLGNVLKSKYCKEVLAILKYWNFKIDDIEIDEYKIDSIDKTNDIKLFNERDWLNENDLDNIKNNSISCIELAKMVDGWHNSLPYVELFKAFDKKELQDNVKEIIHNSCFGYKKFNMYANRFEMLGNYLYFLDLYIEKDYDWDELYNTFIKFLEFSLIKK